MEAGAAPCPSAESLAAFGAGTLGGAAAADLERHIDVCAACRIAVSALGRGRAPAGGLGEGLGRYQLLAPLGAGAMGEVVVAHDPALGRRVALKLMRAAGGAEPAVDRQERMLREARILAQLDHPNVVRVLDVGRDGAGDVWIAMELVEGGSLRPWLAVPRTADEILDAFTGAARGLAAVHAAGVVHRDIKPENLLVAGDGRIVVGDFGLALVHGGLAAVGAGDPRLTASGVVLGTPGYMAPEQLGSGADARCDQFAWCLALWEALFGARPFDDPDPAVRLLRISRAELAPPADRPELAAVADVLRRGLRMGPDERFPSMTALLEALAVARRRRGRAWRWPLGIGLGAVAAIIAIGVAARGDDRADDRAAPAAVRKSGSATDPDGLFPASFTTGLELVLDQAAKNETTKEQQLRALDRRIAAIRDLIEAGKYDEAELQLVDIHWVPVEPGAASEQELARIYDEKRAALDRILARKRAP